VPVSIPARYARPIHARRLFGSACQCSRQPHLPSGTMRGQFGQPQRCARSFIAGIDSVSTNRDGYALRKISLKTNRKASIFASRLTITQSRTAMSRSPCSFVKMNSKRV